MEILFIRHGEPDYQPCDERGFIGHGRALAPLSPEGVLQAEEVSKNPVLTGCEVILSSPYTRALQTAAIISKNTGLSIIVETDLHEWMPDKTFQYKSSAEADELFKDYQNNKGIYPKGQIKKWESVEELIARAVPVLNKYSAYEKIIAVCHGEIIRRFTGESGIEYCKPYRVNFNETFECYPWFA